MVHFCRPILWKFYSPQPQTTAALLSSCIFYNNSRTITTNSTTKRRLLNNNDGGLPRVFVRTTQHVSAPPHGTYSSTPKISVPYLRIASENEAHELVYFLKTNERKLLHKVLAEHIAQDVDERESAETTKTTTTAAAADVVVDKKQLTKEETKTLFLCNALPFIGFGILDNLLMILAGEYIDNTLGLVFGLSTMAAAGLGNILSDIAGVGSAHYVEYMVAKFFDVKPPALTAQQWDSGAVRWTTNAGRCIGLVIGCLIGMFPLLFFDETEKQEKKLKAKAEAEAAAVAT